MFALCTDLSGLWYYSLFAMDYRLRRLGVGPISKGYQGRSTLHGVKRVERRGRGLRGKTGTLVSECLRGQGCAARPNHPQCLWDG